MPLSSFRKAQDRQVISFPPGWTWISAPITIYRDPKGIITTDFDVANFKINGVGKTYYVKKTGGNDNNDGLTSDTAFATLYKAITKADVDIIVVYDGVYTRENAFNDASPARDISIIAATGNNDVIITGHSALTWTKTADKTNVYQATRTLVVSVYDAGVLDANGDYTRLILKTSIDEVDANAGSYYIDGSNVVYVHTADSRAADSSIYSFLNVKAGSVASGKSIYLEGLNFIGGYTPFYALTDFIAVYAKNCTFKYGTQNGFTQMGGTAYLQNCTCSKNSEDGFNYHSTVGEVKPYAIEINCKGYRNGLDTNDNGSSMHDGGKIIRVNGEYYENTAHNVVDVTADTQSWNIGCVAHDSSGGANICDFLVTTGAAKMWLDSCIAYGSTYSLGITDAASICYLRNCTLLPPQSIVGTKVTY